MTTIRVPTEHITSVTALAAQQARPPDSVTAYSADDPSMAELTWTPDLTTDQQAALDAYAHSLTMDRPLTSEQYQAVRTQMQVLRDLRQMGRNAFMALSAAERDRALYDAFTATTQVLLSILRD